MLERRTVNSVIEIERTKGNPIPPFLIMAPIEAPIKNKNTHPKMRVYFSFIAKV